LHVAVGSARCHKSDKLTVLAFGKSQRAPVMANVVMK
jgi:hypothetical protein